MRPWRDPRLLLGIMLVLLATVVGAKLYAARDNTVAYWSLNAAVTSGDRVDSGDLVATRVHLSERAARQYFRVDEEFPAALDTLVWSWDHAAGALVERSAVVDAAAETAVELPLSVATGAFPTDLRSGDRVDVWVGPAPGQAGDEDARRVLRAVRVVSTDAEDDVVGGAASRTIMVSVDEDELTPAAMSAVSAHHVTLVRVR